MSRVQKMSIYSLITVFGAIFLLFIFPAIVYGASPVIEGAQAARGEGQPSLLFGLGGVFTTLSNILLFIVGALSVIMLVIGGLRYVVSGGNSTAVTGAKNTILYAIVGLVVAFLAYAAINFILANLTGGGTSGTDV